MTPHKAAVLAETGRQPYHGGSTLGTECRLTLAPPTERVRSYARKLLEEN